MTVDDWECRINYLKIDVMFILNLLATNQPTTTTNNKMMKKLILTLTLILTFTLNLLAQNSNGVEMADALRSSGKIYIVVSVISVVFIGIAIYLFSMDSRLKKIEKQNTK